MDTETGEMIVKRVSVPIGLEELMEGLVKEVLLKKPDDIYFFAAKYFARLLLLRDKGQNKVTTIRSAQSLTDQRTKRPPTKIPVVGVTKQLSRQFSVRGESPARNFDSPIISQKPKMYDRNEPKYKRRNTGPPTIPESQMNIAIRKKYSRSVSTERKKEIVDTNSNIQKNTIRKRSITRKENKEVRDESNKNDKSKNGGKQFNVPKEVQQHSRLMKNISTTGVSARKFSEEKKISKKDETTEDSESIAETVHDTNKSIQGGNDSSHTETDIVRQSSTNSTHGNVSHQPIKTITSEEHKTSEGESIGKKDIQQDGAEKYTDEIITNENDIEGKTQSNENVDRKFDNLPEIEEKNANEIIKGDSKTNESPEKYKSSSDTLDDLTMGSENGEKGFDEHCCPVSEKTDETGKDLMDNLETVNDVNHNLADLNEDTAHESKKPIENDVEVLREKRNTGDFVNDQEGDTEISDRELEKDGCNRDMTLQENTTEKLLNFDESKIEASNIKLEHRDSSDKIIVEESQIGNAVDKGSIHESSPVSNEANDEKKTNDGLIDSDDVNENDSIKTPILSNNNSAEIIENKSDYSREDVSNRQKSATIEKVDESNDSTNENINSVTGNEVIKAIETGEVDTEKREKIDDDISIAENTSATNKPNENVTDFLERTQKDSTDDHKEEDSHDESSRIIADENSISISEKEENAQSEQFLQTEKKNNEESSEKIIETRGVTDDETDIGEGNIQFQVSNKKTSNDFLLETASPKCEINEINENKKDHNISDTNPGQEKLSINKNEIISEDGSMEKEQLVKNNTSDGSGSNLDSQKTPVMKGEGDPNDQALSDTESQVNSVEENLNVDENTHTKDQIEEGENEKSESIKENNTQTLSEKKQLTSTDLVNSESEGSVIKSDTSNLVPSECEVRKIVNQGETVHGKPESDQKNYQQNDESSSGESLSQKEKGEIINEKVSSEMKKLPTKLSTDSETKGNGEKSDILNLNEYNDDSSGTKNMEINNEEMNNRNETENSTQFGKNLTEAAEDVCIKNKIDELNNINSADENKIDELPLKAEVGKIVDQRETDLDETQSDNDNSLQDDKSSRKENGEKVYTETQEIPARLLNDLENGEKSHTLNLNECEDVLSDSTDIKMHKGINNQNETENYTQNDTHPIEVAEDICIEKKNDKLNDINPAENNIVELSMECEDGKIVDQRKTDQVETQSEHENSQQNDERSSKESLNHKESANKLFTETQELPIHLSNESGIKDILNPNECKDGETNNQNKIERIEKLNKTITGDNGIEISEGESKSPKDFDYSKEISKRSSDGIMDDSETDDNQINILMTKNELVENEKNKFEEEGLVGKRGDNVGNEVSIGNAQENNTPDFGNNPMNDHEHDNNEKNDIEAKLEPDENKENEEKSENVFNNEKKSVDEGIDNSSDGKVDSADLTKKNNGKNEAEVGIIDKVAKNYINYVIDKEKLKYDNDHMDIDNTTQKNVNGMEEDQPKDLELEKNNESHSVPDIQKNENENHSSFDRIKLREELGLSPAEESVIEKEIDNTERNEFKNNITSTLSIATTGMISAPAKKFINDFISNERSKQFGANEENYNVVSNITKFKSNDTKSELDNDVKPNGLESNKFDSSKLREELQKAEQDSKLTSFKHTFNPHILRQELDHTFLLKNSNGYSSSLAKAAAVVRIQSMWRGFIVRKSFPYPSNENREENSNISAEKKQESDEPKPDTFSDKKKNNEDPDLLRAVEIIERCWRGFQVKKNLNKNLSSEGVDDNNHIFETTRAAIKIQKLWRGFITRKKMMVTSRISKNETSVGEVKEGLISSPKPLAKNEEHEVMDGFEAKHIQHLVPPLKNDNGLNEKDTKIVSVSDLEKHEGAKSEEHIVDVPKTDETLSHIGRENENIIIENKMRECATRIQSSWRRFLARKFVEHLKMKMKNETNNEKSEGETQRTASIDSNDSTVTNTVNDSNKNTDKDNTSHGGHLHVFSNNNNDHDDDNTALDEILEYPLIKDEHLIDDYQNELLERISGKRSHCNEDFERLGALSPKRIEDIKAEDMKDIDTLHTSLLQKNSFCQEKNGSEAEQNYHKSKLESVDEESCSGAESDEKSTISVNDDHNLASQNNNVDAETAKNNLSTFCSVPSAPPYESKIIDGKPLSDHVESNLKNENRESKMIENIQYIKNGSKEHSMKSSDLDNVKLFHSGELHDTIVVPLPKRVAESLKTDTGKGMEGNYQGNESSKSIDSTEELSSILSNVGLLHSGELHDGIVVPISLASLGKTISETECNGIDTVDSPSQSVGSSESQTDDKPVDSGGASSLAVQVLRAPEPEVVTSSSSISNVTDTLEASSTQAPDKESLQIHDGFSPLVAHSMESEGAGKTQEENMEAKAATKIQAGFRGYQVRKQLKLKNGSSDMTPAKRQCRGKGPTRSDSAKSQNSRNKEVEEKSAVKIQAGVRGFLVRRRQKKQNNQES